MKAIFGLLALLVSSYASAADISVQAALMNHDCHYWSLTTADVKATYKDINLPWGTRVDLVYGFKEKYGSTGVGTDWQKDGTLVANSVAPFTWQARISNIEMQGRGGPTFFDFQFIFKITLPTGEVFYEKGSASRLGFYTADLSTAPRTCYPGEPHFANIVIDSVRKD